MAYLLKEAKDIFYPLDETQMIALIATILWIVISFICRKEFGGFFSALKDVGLGIIFLVFLGWIHIGLVILVICIALLYEFNIIPKSWSWLIVIVGLLILIGFLFKVGIL